MLDRYNIPAVLESLGLTGLNAAGDPNWNSANDYADLAANWRGDAAVPTQAVMDAELIVLETKISGVYFNTFEFDRDSLLSAVDWMDTRHRNQTDNGETTSLTGVQFTELLNYKKDLRALEGLIAGGTNGTFINPTWTSKPSFVA